MTYNKKIVISGGPGSGKTTIIDGLKSEGYFCLEEISREYIAAGKNEGIENHFEEDPLAFSRLLWEGRINQYQQANRYLINHSEEKFAFFDRSLVDVVAYLKYKNTPVKQWEELLKQYTYDLVFLVAPVEQTYHKDRLRMESFEEAVALHKSLVNTYDEIGNFIDVPFLPPKERIAFILKHCNER